MSRDAASERQVQAADPARSTWLSANAGSGKTRVLTDRVARLLLDGVEPQHILCLTYTKAAASEMQNRLFRRLGEWAMRDDTRLASDLRALGIEGRLDLDTLGRARTLFARAIETPGGLKIQTIHSFCASLLRRFPLEAGVSPQFKEMEDRAGALLRAEIVDVLADGPHAPVVATMATHLGDSFDEITAAIVRARDAFVPALDRAGIRELFGLSPDLTSDSIAGSVFLGDEPALLETLVAGLSEGSSNDRKAAAVLHRLEKLDVAALPKLESVFLTKSGKAPYSAKIGTFPTKDTRTALAEIMPEVEALMHRVENARPMRLGLEAADMTADLHAFAAVFLPAYAEAKLSRGWLDFDDLILRARLLLNDRNVAAWVLFRLDGGIDHILVDEAQDTSPAQWDVIEKLAQEFTSGAGARADVQRTIFVVGDKKQSIYSFQGADPREFDRMREEFRARLDQSETPLQSLGLEYSFRSADAILRLVDTVFDDIQGFPHSEKHLAFKSGMPGRVDLWPNVPATEAEPDTDWEDPLDRPSQTHHTVQLAERIAAEIARMTDPKTCETLPVETPDGGYERRAITPGDILVLVQRRSPLFAEIIRACKSADLPIAGADRLKVGAEMAVRDLSALLSFLATQEDSLALATALRSPLFGWDEDALFRLAHGRSSPFLWPALRDAADTYPETLQVVHDLLDNVDFLRPYDLIERILTRHDGRRKLLARLGAEAEDGIDALLSQALAYEASAVPSLTGFLTWLETDDLEIKRQLDNAGDQVRVMTVHGAKGLEAPVVILPDTGYTREDLREMMLPLGQSVALLPKKDLCPPALVTAREEALAARREERLRLLYVALTRAEKWLIVTSAGDLGSQGDSWYDRVGQAMSHLGAEPCMFAFGQEGLRYELGDWTSAPIRDPGARPARDPGLSDHFHTLAPVASAPYPTLSPSTDLGGAKALPGDAGLEEDAAKLRGTQVHLLLETLPELGTPPDRAVAARVLIQAGHRAEDEVISEALNVLAALELSHVFAGSSMPEVPVSAELAALGGRRVHGVIDRLLVSETTVLAVDFKTNAVVPKDPTTVPDGILRQMGAYQAALARVFPDREVQTAVLWSRTATLMPLPHDLVTAALQNTTIA